MSGAIAKGVEVEVECPGGTTLMGHVTGWSRILGGVWKIDTSAGPVIRKECDLRVVEVTEGAAK